MKLNLAFIYIKFLEKFSEVCEHMFTPVTKLEDIVGGINHLFPCLLQQISIKTQRLIMYSFAYFPFQAFPFETWSFLVLDSLKVSHPMATYVWHLRLLVLVDRRGRVRQSSLYWLCLLQYFLFIFFWNLHRKVVSIEGLK